jgi:lysozyme
MNVNQFVSGHEGRRRKPYLDTAKPPKWTVGCGWNMTDNPLPKPIKAYLDEHGEITEEMIDQLLDMSIKTATFDCHKLFPDFDNFTENRRMALVDFTFQLGYNRAKKFVHAIAAINTGRWEDAKKEMLNSTWANQCHNRAADVTKLILEG